MSDFHNPLSVVIPNSFPSQQDYPTEVIAQRFQAYRYIIKDLVSYLKQYASVQEEIVRQQVRLQSAVGSATSSISAVNGSRTSHAKSTEKDASKDELSLINHYFLPIGNGSIQDIPTVLTKFHQQNIHNGNKTLKEINQVTIPKLEDLRKDLLVKIKEIKNLQNDFKNSLGKEIAETRSLLSQFNHATDVANHLELLNSNTESHHHDAASDVDSVKKDPYLVKLKLERQLRKQLAEESYLYEAYKNLQSSSEKLESIVVLEIQNYLRIFLGLVETEHSSVSNFLVPSMTNGFLAKEPNFEWDSFVERNLPKSSNISNNLVSGKFIDLTFPARKLSDLSIPHYDSLVNVAVREGTLERRSKFLKSYSSGWYVLTCSYIHEFKTPDRRKDQTPVMSLSLDYCSVSEHSKNDGKSSGAYKFVLYSKSSNGLIHRGHNWVFRCDTYNSMIEWYNDIKTLTSLASPTARAKAMSKKLQANNSALLEKRISRASSVLSNGGRSMKSTTSTNAKLQNRLSPMLSNGTSRSVAPSQNLSVSSTQNPRLSSTFSQKFQQSPKLSNLINSDGTIVTPIDTRADDTYHEVDQNGDVTFTTQKSVPDINVNASQQQQQQQAPAQQAPIAIPIQPSYNTQVTPQQTVPQNYQYYVNQVTPQPQQFYDPVSQQFFTINAIPASQVSQMTPHDGKQGTTVNQGQQAGGSTQPMPQYFPSSPQPNAGAQYFPASPNIQPQVAPKSPRAGAGQYIPVQGDGVIQYNHVIPHFPQQFHEGVPGSAPYPIQLGDNLVSSRQSSTVTQPEEGEKAQASELPNPNVGGEESADGEKDTRDQATLDDQISKLTMTDEKPHD